MDPLTIAIIALSTAASIGSKAKVAYDEDKYNDQVDEYNNKQIDIANKMARKNAIARAIGYDKVPAVFAEHGPEKPDTALWKTIGNIADVVGSVAMAPGAAASGGPGAAGLTKGAGGAGEAIGSVGAAGI